MLGYSERQLKRWFDAYRDGGLEMVLERGKPGGSPELVTPEAWAGLEEEMKAGRIGQLEDARRYLADVMASSMQVSPRLAPSSEGAASSSK